MKKCCLVKSNCFFSFIIMLVASLAISCSGSDEFNTEVEDPQTRATFDSDAFVTEWLVPAGGVITLPIDTNLYYNCIIDWGDNCNLTYIFDRTDYNSNFHKYVEAGTYRVKIIGIFPAWRWVSVLPCREYLTKIVQWGNVHFQKLHMAFMGYDNLTSIPAGIPNIESYHYTFTGCFGLTSLPDELFSNSVDATDFTSTFENCPNLRTLPPNLFKNCINARTFTGTFMSSGLVSLPAGLFNDCVRATGFEYTFASCQYLTAIPADLFSRCTEVTTFFDTFEWCCLTSIPTTLFANCKKVTNFVGTFQYCYALTGTTPVSDGFELWQRAGNEGYPDIIDGSGCFSGCSGLEGFLDRIDKNWK